MEKNTGNERLLFEMMDNNELILLEQPAIIKQRLAQLKQHWDQMAADAEAMVCNEETIQAVKKFRSDMRKEFAEVDELRKQIKKAITDPYEKFYSIYKECVYDSFENAEKAFVSKISAIESEIKARCEESLREYFSELCAAHHVDWLQYEQAGIKIDMASARQKTPKKLREQLVCFVVRVASDMDTISTLGNAEEILAEYKLCLSLSHAIGTATERHRRIESERQALDTRSTERAAEIEAERRIEALGPPVIVKPPEVDENQVIPRCTFTAINATRAQLRRLREFMDEEGIRYE